MSETNILDASVALTLGGKVYRLSYRAHAFIMYAEVCGADLLQDIRSFGERFSGITGVENVNSAQLFIKVRDMFWAGLLEHDPNADRLAVAHLFGFSDLIPIMGALTEALRLTAPAAETRPINPPPDESHGARINGLASGAVSEIPAELPPASSAG